MSGVVPSAGARFGRVTRGAYVPAALVDDLAARCRALHHVRPDLIASHWTAVVLLGLRLPPGRSAAPLHVTAGPGTWPGRRHGVVMHVSSRPVPVVPSRGTQVTTPCRTWCDLAADGASAPELVVVADALVARDPAALGALRSALAAGHVRRGARVARTALDLVDPRSESPMESWLRVLLVLAGVPAPVVQHVVRDAGRFVARVDLAWPDRRLVVEYDGAHHLGRAQWVADLRRREALERAGWTVVVLTAEDVLGRPDDAVHRVASRLS